MRLFGPPRIFKTVFALFLAVSIVPLLLLAFVNYNVFSVSLKGHIQNKLAAVSDGKLRLIEQKLDAISSFITEKSYGPTPVKAFVGFSEIFKRAGVHSGEYEALDMEFRGAFQKYLDIEPSLRDIIFISSAGDVIFTMNRASDLGANIRSPLLKDSPLAGLVDIVRNTLTTSYSELALYPPSGRNLLFIATPVFGDNRLLGTLAFQLEPDELYKMTQNYVGLPATGDIVFGKISGNEILFTAPTRAQPDGAMKIRLSMGSEIAIAMQRAVAGETGVGFARDYLGHSVLARWQYVPHLRWGMVVKADTDDVFAPLYRIRNMTILALALLGAFIFLASMLTAGSISGPIKKICEGLRIIGGGDLKHRIDIVRGDEIGELADDVNKMAKNLALAEGVLVRQRDDLRRSNLELEQFAFVASHDLQEPLRMVISYTQLLERRYREQLDDSAKKYINYAVDGALRMRAFIDDLLQYSRVGRKNKPFTLVDMNAVYVKANKNIEMATKEHHAIVTADELLSVVGDESWLTLLLQNLIGNGIKFHGKEPPRVHVSSRDVGEEVVFSVADNGIGIEAQYKEKIFVLFQRLHTRDEYAGTGIGLAICKKIAEYHGGRIWMESEVGKGTKFLLAIPKNGEKRHDEEIL